MQSVVGEDGGDTPFLWIQGLDAQRVWLESDRRGHELHRSHHRGSTEWSEATGVQKGTLHHQARGRRLALSDRE